MKPGDRLGPYTILEVLPQGGMGQVFRAQKNGETVALKILGSQSSSQAVNRFRREARTVKAPRTGCGGMQ